MIEKMQGIDSITKQQRESIDMIYLISCALHDTIPDRIRVEKMNLSGIFQMAQFHLLSAMTYMALDAAGVFKNPGERAGEDPDAFFSTDAELAKRWKEQKEKAIRKNLLLDIQRREICSDMEREGIWYLPLKGIVLKDRYPKAGMRQMADNDILFDREHQWKLKEIMESRGLQTVVIGKGNHDVYEKKPIYNFEMHTALYGQGHDEGWVSYYSDVKERLIRDTQDGYGYHFSDEDFYVYLITHACKHHKGSGTGIRSLLDIYVYLMEKESAMDWDYITRELGKLHVEAFEAKSRALAKKLFSQEVCELTAEETGLLTYVLESGTYGTLKNRVEKKLQEYQPDGQPIQARTRKKYLWKRLFPDEEYYRQYAPFAYRHQWFRPFFVVFRMFRGILRNGKKIVSEVRVVLKK